MNASSVASHSTSLLQRSSLSIRTSVAIRTVMNVIIEVIALSSIWLIFWVYWSIYAVYARRNAKSKLAGESNTRRILHVITVMAAVFITFSRFEGLAFWNRIIPSNIVIEWAGIAVTALSLSLSVWARQILGNNWSGKIRRVEGQTLIISGPYRRIRNPIYTGIICGFLGSFITMGTVSSLVGFLLVLVAYLIKIKREEKFLLIEFGAEYREYIKRSWALVPYIY
jgi:protein-S-isoprenylcysteine O-methyltransferase Ste14